MKLGKRENYYSQRNDASAELLKAYKAKSKYVACGPNAVLCGMEISGWLTEEYDHIWGEGMQKTDAYMMMLYNPSNEYLLEKIRADALEYPKQEIPQYLTLINHFYKKKVVHFSWGCNISIIKAHLKSGQPVVVCGKFPGIGGHYVLIRGMEKNDFIYSDSYNLHANQDYFSKKMTFEFFEKYINKTFLLFIEKNEKI